MVNWGIAIYSLLDFFEQLNTNMVFNWSLSIHVNFFIIRKEAYEIPKCSKHRLLRYPMSKMFHDTSTVPTYVFCL